MFGKLHGLGIRSWLGKRGPRSIPSYEALAGAFATNVEMADAYDSLLSSFELAGNGKPRKIFLVTSTRPGEGKTTIVINLAIASLIAGRRVLLSDGDLRRPSLHRVLGLDNQRGLADLLVGQCGPTDVLQSVSSRHPQIGEQPLSVVTSGTATPRALHALGTPQAKAVLQDMAKGFDIVLIDSPPVLATNDPVLLASAADGVVFVIDAGDVGEREARRAKQRMEQTGTPIMGAVLNRFDERLHGAGAHHYRNYYYGTVQEQK